MGPDVVTHTKKDGATRLSSVSDVCFFPQLLSQSQGGQQDMCLHKKTRPMQPSPDE